MKSSVVVLSFLSFLSFAALTRGGRALEAREESVVTQPALDLVRMSTAVHYDSIDGGASLIRRSVSLCDLAKKNRGGAGLYRVVRMTGYLEKSPTDGREKGYTYVQLALLEAWSQNAPANPTVRIVGGPSRRAGVTQLWRFSAKVGEVFGVMLREPTAGNSGFYGLADNAVFKLDGAGYTNGQLFRDKPARAGDLRKALGLATDAMHRDPTTCRDVVPMRAPRPLRREADGLATAAPLQHGD